MLSRARCTWLANGPARSQDGKTQEADEASRLKQRAQGVGSHI